uniref:VTC2 n=1 Tax=Solanum tuberosum TaxID=4113 RepID=M1D0Q3_SOLTU
MEGKQIKAGNNNIPSVVPQVGSREGGVYTAWGAHQHMIFILKIEYFVTCAYNSF